jgi:hypothetical protein
MAGQLLFSMSDTSPIHRSHRVGAERMVFSGVSHWQVCAMGMDEQHFVLCGIDSRKTLAEA